MRIFPLLLGVLFVSCNTPQSVEERLYDCLKESYNNQGVDLEEAVDKAQQHLINQGALEDATAASIQRAIEKIELIGEADYEVQWDSVELVSKLVRDSASLPCRISNLETISNDTSEKLYKINYEFSKITEPTASKVASVYLKYLSESDFGLAYYKTAFISILCMLGKSKTDFGLRFLLPPLPENGITDTLVDTVLVVYIKKNNNLVINNKETKRSRLENMVMEFVEINGLNGAISIQNENGTSYDTYVKVQDLIKSGYQKVWDEYSLKTFNKPFLSLNEPEKKVVKSRFPYRVKERQE